MLTIAPPAAFSLSRASVHVAHRAGEIDREHFLEHAHVVLGAAADDAGAVDEDVEPRQVRHECGDRRLVAHVHRHGVAAAKRRGAARGHAFGGRRARDGDDGAQLGERVGDAGADAGRAADHQHDLAGKQIRVERVVGHGAARSK